MLEALESRERWGELDRLTPLPPGLEAAESHRERVRGLAGKAEGAQPELARRVYLRLIEHALPAIEDPALRAESCVDMEAAQKLEYDAGLALRLGRLYERDERWDAALEHFLPLAKARIAQERGLDHAEHLLHCAALLRRTGHLERAASFMTEAMGLVDATAAEALAEELYPLWIEAGRKPVGVLRNLLNLYKGQPGTKLFKQRISALCQRPPSSGAQLEARVLEAVAEVDEVRRELERRRSTG